VPGPRRGRGERRLEAALEALAGALNETRAPWMVIGGVAVIARGVKRMTTDLDVVVRGDAIALPALMDRLAAWKIVARIADAEAFARQNFVLLMRHQPSGVDLDVSLGWTEFEHRAIEASSTTAFGTVRAPMAQPQDLVIFKVVAARPKDVEDATSLLVMHRSVDLTEIRRRVAELSELADDPSMIEGLEAIVERARPPAAAPVKRRKAASARTPSKKRAGRKRPR
jgi:hypothetical protein